MHRLSGECLKPWADSIDGPPGLHLPTWYLERFSFIISSGQGQGKLKWPKPLNHFRKRGEEQVNSDWRIIIQVCQSPGKKSPYSVNSKPAICLRDDKKVWCDVKHIQLYIIYETYKPNIYVHIHMCVCVYIIQK